MGLLGLVALPLGWLAGHAVFGLELAAAVWGANDAGEVRLRNLIFCVAVAIATLAWGFGWMTYQRRVNLEGPVRYVTRFGLPASLVFVAVNSYFAASAQFDVF